MAKRISLREFQENLSRRLAAAQSGQRRALLGVQAGDENWLVDLAATGEILPVPALASVPLTRPWFNGVVNVRGSLYGVVDFSAFHGGAPIPPAGHARLLLIGAKLGMDVRIAAPRALWPSEQHVKACEEFAAQSGARLLLMGGAGLIFFLLVAATVTRLLGHFRATPGIGDILATKMLGMILLAFMSILLLSNIITALSSFFLARDLELLAAAPLDSVRLYAARLVETLGVPDFVRD